VKSVEDAERLEELDKLLADMAEASLKIPIIVEGKRDTKALRALGIEGKILELNVGKGVIDFCESIAKEHRAVILLTDWDAKGGTLFRTLADSLKSLDVKVDGDYRRELARLAKKGAKDVEGVPGFILWLVEQDAAGLNTTIEHRRYVSKWREKRLANEERE
jgi:5S rRNA maturation endonuclease (ribonuclease M5)